MEHTNASADAARRGGRRGSGKLLRLVIIAVAVTVPAVFAMSYGFDWYSRMQAGGKFAGGMVGGAMGPVHQADFSDWLKGAAGFEKAARLNKKQRTPALVYFTAKGSQACKDFDLRMFGACQIQGYLAKKVLSAVVLDQAGTEAERQVARRYGIAEAPAVIVLGPDAGSVKQIVPMEDGADWRKAEPCKFLESILAAAGINEKPAMGHPPA